MRQLKKIILTSITSLLCILQIKAYGADDRVIVGMELANPPFETINLNGEPIGVSVDIAEEYGKWVQKKIQISNIPFIGLIPSLKSRKIDVILSSMTPTYERKKSISFTDPYLSIGICILFNIHCEARNADQLKEKKYTIVVKTGTTAQQHAKKLFPKAEILSLEQESLCIAEVLQGKADAFLYDQLSIYATWKKYPNQTKIDLTPIIQEYWAMGVRKDDAALRESLNNFLKDFDKAGGFEKLQKKYFFNEQMEFEKMGVPLIFSPNKLRD
jgi:polar amino acid transport system substrate-binding protein